MKRNLSPEPRKEHVRPLQGEVIRFDLDTIYEHFEKSLERVQGQFVIAEQLLEEKKEELCEEIWRAQITFIVSAFDFYLHEILKYSVYSMYMGNWQPTEAYKKERVRIPIVRQEVNNKDPEQAGQALLNEINDNYAYQPFISTGKVGWILKMVSNKKIKWLYDQLNSRITMDGFNAEEAIEKLFQRRNQIVHQFDRIHENAQRIAIGKDDVEKSLLLVEEMSSAIYKLCNTNGSN